MQKYIQKEENSSENKLLEEKPLQKITVSLCHSRKVA